MISSVFRRRRSERLSQLVDEASGGRRHHVRSGADDNLADLVPGGILIVNTGLNLRSGAQSVNIRPVNSLNYNANYFLPSTMGGDHAFKFGGYWRDALSDTISHTGGNATARYPTQAAYDANTCATGGVAAGCGASLTRDGQDRKSVV